MEFCCMAKCCDFMELCDLCGFFRNVLGNLPKKSAFFRVFPKTPEAAFSDRKPTKVEAPRNGPAKPRKYAYSFDWRVNVWTENPTPCPPPLSGEGVRFNMRGIFRKQISRAFAVRFCFYHRLFRFCSPVPEREGGQGEGFDFAQLADDYYTHTRGDRKPKLTLAKVPDSVYNVFRLFGDGKSSGKAERKTYGQFISCHARL